MTDFSFSPERESNYETVSSNVLESGFYNLKNKQTGPRRYAFRSTITKCTNPDGSVGYRGEMQALLNGDRYQSGKDVLRTTADGHKSRWFDNPDVIREALGKMVATSLKSYARKAQDPANKIEARF